MRRAEARSAEIERRDGVTLAFQVSVYSVEPCKAVRARNLLSNDDARSALLNELKPGWPEVPLVVEALAEPGSAEGLAGA